MVSGIMVDYYGAPTPIQSLANITVPEARINIAIVNPSNNDTSRITDVRIIPLLLTPFFFSIINTL